MTFTKITGSVFTWASDIFTDFAVIVFRKAYKPDGCLRSDFLGKNGGHDGATSIVEIERLKAFVGFLSRRQPEEKYSETRRGNDTFTFERKDGKVTFGILTSEEMMCELCLKMDEDNFRKYVTFMPKALIKPTAWKLTSFRGGKESKHP